jgi:hypothetical protein
MGLSDLQSPRGPSGKDSLGATRALFDRQSNSEGFVTQMAATNSEIDAAKFEIERLMTRAHPFAKNSGLGSSGIRLAATPPRFPANTPLSATKLFQKSSRDKSVFTTTPPRPKPQ